MRHAIAATIAALTMSVPHAEAHRPTTHTFTSAVTAGRPGNCDSWRPAYQHMVQAGMFGRRGAPGWTWFRTVMRRESGCGLDRFNERTGDSGLFQLNPVHRHWLLREQGIHFSTLRWNNVAGLKAMAALYRKVGTCAWNPRGYCG